MKPRVAVLVPHRNDRPEFLKNCIRMIGAQTFKPDHVEIYNAAPLSDAVDISWRYRKGYEKLTAMNKFDLIAFMEDDDWYSIHYLAYMVSEWKQRHCPDLFGTNKTIYYHLKLNRYFIMQHETRASAMNTFIKPGLSFKWGLDHDPYTDVWLWNEIPNRKIIQADGIYSVGIKHGLGKLGGRNHIDKLHRYINEDKGFFANTLDFESYEFYFKIAQTL